jgi:uncharacterized protein YbbK (DUF523 family)
MEDYPRPRLVVSRCLELAACRYNGATIRAPLVRRLEPYVELVPICPEVEVGLGVPRDPVRLVSPGDPPGGGGALARRELRMVQPKSGRDLTAAMNSFSDDFLSRVEPVEGFLLKSRSPSCGIKDTKVYTDAEEPMPLGKDAGLFARAVLDRFGDRAVEDEGRLTNFRLRHHFLTKLFTLARIRTLEDGGRMRDLVELHARHKLLLMAYHQTCMRRMGRLVGSSDGLPFPELLAAYRRELGTALARPGEVGRHPGHGMEQRGRRRRRALGCGSDEEDRQQREEQRGGNEDLEESAAGHGRSLPRGAAPGNGKAMGPPDRGGTQGPGLAAFGGPTRRTTPSRRAPADGRRGLSPSCIRR